MDTKAFFHQETSESSEIPQNPNSGYENSDCFKLNDLTERELASPRETDRKSSDPARYKFLTAIHRCADAQVNSPYHKHPKPKCLPEF